MNTKEIKNAARNGKTFNIYNVKLSKIIETQSENGTFADVTFVASTHFNNGVLDIHDFNNIKVCDTPKYDPCRKFREGDIAKPRIVDGRKEFHFNDGDILKVYKDEDDYNRVYVENQDGVHICTEALFLELITPVEEVEPYSVLETDTTNGFDIIRDGLCVMTFPFGSKEAGYYRNKLAAKEAAEAECKRLNAKHRKAQR